MDQIPRRNLPILLFTNNFTEGSIGFVLAMASRSMHSLSAQRVGNISETSSFHLLSYIHISRTKSHNLLVSVSNSRFTTKTRKSVF